MDSTALSLSADLTLSSILIVLWLVRREDLYALLWGGGQILISLATLGGPVLALHSPSVRGLLMLCMVLGIAGYGFGTRHFCGLPLHWRRGALVLAVLTPAMLVLATLSPALGRNAAFLCLGGVLLWSALQLRRCDRAYHLLALLLLLRAMLNLSGPLLLWLNDSIAPILALGFLLKTASSLGLIHAVLRESQALFRATIDGQGNGFLIRNEAGEILAANDKFAQLIGRQHAQELLGRNINDIASGRSAAKAHEWFLRVTAAGAQIPLISEDEYIIRDGQRLPVELISSPCRIRGQLSVLTQILDISQRKQQEQALVQAANIDPVTGLFNRPALQRHLQTALILSGQSASACSVLLIDLDHFRRINDTLGHSVGDELLRLVGQRLRKLAGSEDVLARFGGDEFVIVSSQLDLAAAEETATRLAQRILDDLRDPFELPPFRVAMAASIGIALSPAHGTDPENLLRAADSGMYAAKDSGRGRLKVFEEAFNTLARDALLIDEALQHAIARNEFRLVYQPIVEARSRKLSKVEALIRWSTPRLGFVGPDRFIPIAEESGLIVEIGCWVLQEATRQARSWADEAAGPICVSVNVSAAQLVDPDFLLLLREFLARSGAAPDELEIELTERVLIDEADTVIRVIDAVNAMGIGVSLDDFGTGYSSLSYLTRFHLQTLKIDRAFVNGIERSERNLALVRAIIAMGHSLGMKIVAEGVETEEQARMLTELGCEYLQGYLISRPVPAAEIRR
ncbi:bifunctional diguanylate cyclase/phosphodiesterase [Uliginosibacterium sp. TH139]|uniref:putative bifunctional diguanylate cyclase/phosphodiesterase n=1 Tax=Uliginosibacterium sp. TH139 TaxID=2067453 RepID=UPI000C7A5398|nr:EAL domain-containing protein [Uliginosibacterium sp. TH139]PLK49242.1 diguanylate cyclase [Uliginosibacterium sp. TH139]